VTRDLYQAYVDNGVVGSDPLQLVVAMYETAILRTREARMCLESGDVWGRARAISKAVNILTELISSLNPEVSGAIGPNLDRLYHYMQRKLQEAHVTKKPEPLVEVEKLLTQLLEAWYKVAETAKQQESKQLNGVVSTEPSTDDVVSTYGSYLVDTDTFKGRAVSA
jgi:flagellar protein FliS